MQLSGSQDEYKGWTQGDIGGWGMITRWVGHDHKLDTRGHSRVGRDHKMNARGHNRGLNVNV